jgi:hypothetical protein
MIFWLRRYACVPLVIALVAVALYIVGIIGLSSAESQTVSPNLSISCTAGCTVSNGAITPTSVLLSTRSVNLNSTGDTSIAVPLAITKYQVTGVLVTNCSATPTLATLGLYTAASAGGTAVVTAATITAATASTVILSQTIASSAAQTASTLYAHVGTANGSALTCDLYVQLLNLT